MLDSSTDIKGKEVERIEEVDENENLDEIRE